MTGPLGAAYALAGQPDRGISLLEQTVEQADAIRLLAHQALRFVWLGEANRLAGRSEAARGLARRALQLAESARSAGTPRTPLGLIGAAAATARRRDLAGAATGATKHSRWPRAGGCRLWWPAAVLPWARSSCGRVSRTGRASTSPPRRRVSNLGMTGAGSPGQAGAAGAE